MYIRMRIREEIYFDFFPFSALVASAFVFLFAAVDSGTLPTIPTVTVMSSSLPPLCWTNYVDCWSNIDCTMIPYDLLCRCCSSQREIVSFCHWQPKNYFGLISVSLLLREILIGQQETASEVQHCK